MSAAEDGLRLLHVHAHPDDESSKGAASTAYYVARGTRVMVVSCTGGEEGEILNPKLDTPQNWARLPDLRREEMAAAAQILGIEHVWLGYRDSGFPDGPDWKPTTPEAFALADVGEAAGRLVRVIRDFRPQVLTTYDERGGYPHPDHIKTHTVSMAAVEAAADATRFPEHGQPWQVSKVYYQMGFHRGRYAALDEAMHAHGLESPYAQRLADWSQDADARLRPTTFVPAADFFEVRNQALLAHATQIDPDGFWFAVPLEIEKKGWPTEDFQLARSTVPVSLPEDDLFAGIAEAGESRVGPWCYSI
ncbi:MAG: mycothiol conjugate amidase Mca [Propionicimonas sp.]|uniref:mycothiol conjugate amidase Mca n=1 Tax=Propionicimonas sp. TaxID=1955623 RepID=UPI002B1F6DC8|nr:mycothiol conjugate amidase Mca [Propionicimonas sp.]MEA4943572.1 mycothiol conjugate amidase Mca [Propionicimonas sp.]MEA5054438.1 mycothiol conjugate amidase Mca [Propionicimonas sp.]